MGEVWRDQQRICAALLPLQPPLWSCVDLQHVIMEAHHLVPLVHEPRKDKPLLLAEHSHQYSSTERKASIFTNKLQPLMPAVSKANFLRASLTGNFAWPRLKTLQASAWARGGKVYCTRPVFAISQRAAYMWRHSQQAPHELLTQAGKSMNGRCQRVDVQEQQPGVDGEMIWQSAYRQLQPAATQHKP